MNQRISRMSLLILTLAVIGLQLIFAETKEESPKAVAWWGTLYPEFCYMPTEESKEKTLKIEFWLTSHPGLDASALFPGCADK